MSRPRLCWHCQKPIAPHRGRPSHFCEPAHKLAWKAAQKPERPAKVRRGGRPGRAVVDAPAAKPVAVGRRPGAVMSGDAQGFIVRSIGALGARVAVLEAALAAGPKRRTLETSGEGQAHGPVSRRHVPAGEVRQ